MRIVTNAPYPNRIQLILDTLLGPFAQNGPLGDFDPRRDLEIYVDGILIPVISFSFDANNNRYLLYMDRPINLQGVVQVIHHMPPPPFATAVPPPPPVVMLPGFQDVTGNGAFGIFPDIDGHSIWSFRYFDAFAKKIDLDTNTVSIDWNPIPFVPRSIQDGTPVFFQDSAGNVFIQSGTVLPQLMHKYTVPAMTASGTIDLNFPTTFSSAQDFCTFTHSGKDYAVMAGNNNRGIILNLTDMVVHGYFGSDSSRFPSNTGNNSTVWGCWVDKNSDIWFQATAINGNVGLFRWNFAMGTTALVGGDPWLLGQAAGGRVILNAVLEHTVLDASLNNNSAEFVTYVSSNHSVILGNTVAFTGDLVSIDLVTGAVLVNKPDDLTTFYNGTFDAPMSAFRQGVQANGKLAIPGDLIQPASPQQRGGTVHLINPTTLAIVNTYNLHTILTASSLTPLPPPENEGGTPKLTPIANMLYFGARRQIVATFEYIGSPVFVFNI